jgi:hypothetical protein
MPIRSLIELQQAVRSASSWSELHEVLTEGYDSRYIGNYPTELLAFVPYNTAKNQSAQELLYQPKISLSRLNKRGWTEKLVKAFLPEPQLFSNPHGGRSAMRLWLISDVQQAERLLDAELKQNRNRSKKGVAA